MNLFKNYTYTWYQIGIFKLAMLSIGVIIGSYYAELVTDNMMPILGIAVLASVYTMYKSFTQ